MIAHRGIAQLVEYRSPKPWVAGSNPPAPAKKSKSKDLDIFICAAGTTSFERQLNIVAAPRGTNERGYAVGVNEVAFGK